MNGNIFCERGGLRNRQIILEQPPHMKLNRFMHVPLRFFTSSASSNTARQIRRISRIVALYAGIMGMGVLGVILYEGVDRIERKYCRWMFNA